MSVFYAALLLLFNVSGSFQFQTSTIKSTAIQSRTRRQQRLCMAETPPRKGPADNDFISNFFSKFLPTPEDVGLTRYDSNSRPENYPCVKDLFADPLPSDKGDADKALIRQALAKTNLENRDLQLAYDANRDGWNPKIFHAKLDKKGPAVVLARSISGGVFGGYNPTGWANYGEYRGSIAAFLFVFPGGDIKQRPIKLAKIGGAGLAQIDDGQGPRFGSEGLTILLERSRPKQVRCKLGLYYERLPGEGKSFLPGGKGEDELVDLKIYIGVYAPGEKVPYDDAMPFSLN